MFRKVLRVSPFILLVCLVALVSYVLGLQKPEDSVISQLVATPKPTPLAAYAIPALQSNPKIADRIEIVGLLSQKPTFVSKKFEMYFAANPSKIESKKTSGMVNIPEAAGQYPLIVMVRGYVDQSIYQTGVGTKNAGEYFAANGYITMAPDFLGYADSDTEAGNIFESRFQTYTTMLSLFQLINTQKLPTEILDKWDKKNVFIWAHSNGGQITLTTLAITKGVYPTVLWAPVTKPFPYSVLYYTDDSADGGKLIRRELAKFEDTYDVNLYSFTNYLTDIHAPIQFEQGTADDAIQFVWTRSMANILKKQGNDIQYNQYPGSDHNLRPAWNEVVAKDLEFYKKNTVQ
jgi:dienelactone hydrolase